MKLPLRLAAGLVVVFAIAGLPHAVAKLGNAELKELEGRFNDLFKGPGDPDGKKDVLTQLASDAQPRSLKMLADGLLKQCVILWDLRAELQQVTVEHADAMNRRFKGTHNALEKELQELQGKLKDLDASVASESEVMDTAIDAVASAPEALRKNIFRRAKTSKQWVYRAAAARIAGAKMAEEKNARLFVQRVLIGDKDRRVRSAALEMVGQAESDWEELVMGRLGDADWGVQLMAVRILHERDYKPAVPHLIQALGKTTPRVAEAMGAALQHFTGEKIEPFADAWQRWWEDHKEDWDSKVEVKKQKKEEFKSVHFYGMEVKSDKVIFIIDVSKSMELETKNHNPREKWKPAGPTTGGGKAPPPPPPPPEILSGPKIDVAKHELKKAISGLASDAKFTIIAFKSVAKAWRPQLVEANKKNKAAALKWVRNMKPSGVTYIDGALRLAFQIGGVTNVDDKYASDQVDTIVLVSDGAPTDNKMPKPKLMDPEIILKHVREWNAKKKVVINCISVDMLPGVKFMKDLADQNGGKHIDR